MSFSDEVKMQLYKAEIRSDCCAYAELLGVLCNRDDRIAAVPVFIKRLILLADKSELPPLRFGVVSAKNGKEKKEAFVYFMKPPLLPTAFDSCCARGFLRGCFVACGSVNTPEKTAHLEMKFSDMTVYDLCRETMIMAGFEPKSAIRGRTLLLYMKRSSQIVDFLTYLGAYKAVLDFESAKVERELRNDVNRAVNCDLANIRKMGAAAQRQILDIQTVREAGMYEQLSPPVRELAALRMKHPEADLISLGKMLSPPISKSGAEHRFLVIHKTAEEIRKK